MTLDCLKNELGGRAGSEQTKEKLRAQLELQDRTAVYQSRESPVRDAERYGIEVVGRALVTNSPDERPTADFTTHVCLFVQLAAVVALIPQKGGMRDAH